VKNTIAAFACVASLSFAAPGLAGNLSEPMMEPEVVVEDTAQSSSSEDMQSLLAALTVMLMIIGVGT
jgi:hypothetical protein